MYAYKSCPLKSASALTNLVIISPETVSTSAGATTGTDADGDGWTDDDDVEARNCDCWHCVDLRSREAEERERSAGRSDSRRFNRPADSAAGEC